MTINWTRPTEQEIDKYIWEQLYDKKCPISLERPIINYLAYFFTADICNTQKLIPIKNKRPLEMHEKYPEIYNPIYTEMKIKIKERIKAINFDYMLTRKTPDD